MGGYFEIELSDSDSEPEPVFVSPNSLAISLSYDSETELENTGELHQTIDTDSETESDEETVIVAGQQFDKNCIEGLETQDIFADDCDINNLDAATYTNQENSSKKRKAYSSSVRNLGNQRDRTKRLRNSLDKDELSSLQHTLCKCGKNCFQAFNTKHVLELRN